MMAPSQIAGQGRFAVASWEAQSGHVDARSEHFSDEFSLEFQEF